MNSLLVPSPLTGQQLLPPKIPDPLRGGLASTKWLCQLLSIGQATFWRWMALGRIGPEPVIALSRRCYKWNADECQLWVSMGCPSREEWRRRKAGGHVSRKPAA